MWHILVPSSSPFLHQTKLYFHKVNFSLGISSAPHPFLCQHLSFCSLSTQVDMLQPLVCNYLPCQVCRWWLVILFDYRHRSSSRWLRRKGTQVMLNCNQTEQRDRNNELWLWFNELSRMDGFGIRTEWALVHSQSAITVIASHRRGAQINCSN